MLNQQQLITNCSPQRILSHSRIEVEIPLQTTQPIRRMIRSIYRRYRMRRHFNLHTIPSLQFGSVLPVEIDAGRAPRVAGYVTSQYYVVGKYHGAEAEDVWADGCD
jgi:hypothetical protein